MRSMYRFGSALMLLCGAASAWAVETSTGGFNTGDPGSAAWDYVGTIGSGSDPASGEFLGTFNGSSWVITATHVGAGVFTLGGITYQPVANSSFTIDNTDGSPSDITLFRISTAPALADLTIAGGDLSVGSTIQMIGNGGGTKAWADNTIYGYSNYTLMGSTINGRGIVTLQSTGGQLIGGDSGGGAFYDDAGTWVLVGINSGAGTITGEGEGSIMVDVGYYATKIVAEVDSVSAVPEIPWAGLGAGLACVGWVLGKRRRSTPSVAS